MTKGSRVSVSSGVMLAVVAVAGLMAFAWPLLIPPSASVSSMTTSVLILAMLVPCLMAVVAAQLAREDMDVKELAMLGVLTAIGAALRPLGAGTAGFETVFFVLILGARVYGATFGFVLGTTTLFASALLTGSVGPWLPYQMIASGYVGLLAGLLPPTPQRPKWVEIALLAAYGAVSAFVFGLLMDFAFWPFAVGGANAGFDPSLPIAENLHRFIVVNAVTGMGWNLGRAITNVLAISLLGPPVLRVLRRASRRASFAP